MEFKYGKEYFEAASELKAPIIIDGAGIHQIEEISDAVHFYEKKFPEVTAALNLDHGGPFEEIIQAIPLWIYICHGRPFYIGI